MHRLFRQWISRALIVIAVIFLGVLVNKDNRAVQYISKCKRVEPGMTLEQAKRIMGGHEGDYQMRNKGQNRFQFRYQYCDRSSMWKSLVFWL
jgi:hypothetical protein